MTAPRWVLPAFCAIAFGTAGPTGAAAQGKQEVECSSSDGKRKNCAVPNLDAKSVTVASKLSQAACDRGRSWDADSAGIWVSQGCRARFAFHRRMGGAGPGAGGDGVSTQALNQACIKRAAREWAVTEANLEVGDKRDLSDGTFEIPISSKRTKGFCVVDRSGNVRSLYAP